MTDTEYLRGLADNENLPILMRDSLREAADEIERLRVEVAASLEREARFVLEVARVMLEDGE